MKTRKHPQVELQTELLEVADFATEFSGQTHCVPGYLRFPFGGGEILLNVVSGDWLTMLHRADEQLLDCITRKPSHEVSESRIHGSVVDGSNSAPAPRRCL